MRAAHPVAEVRAAEEPLLASLPAGTLMQRAANGLARRCAQLLPGVYGGQVLLLVGGGNNGADALWAGVRLARRGAAVTALLAADAEPEALGAFRRAGGRALPVGERDAAHFAAADLVVDGLVGIGGKGELRPPAARLARLAAAAAAPVVAVDVPSGVDADTGEVTGEAVRADVTVTFGTYKPGLLVGAGAVHAGVVELVDIGLHLPRARLQVLDAADVARLLPRPTAASDKYSRGVVGVAAGSPAYTGAPVLAVGGALRAGIGMVRFAGAPEAAAAVRARWPEAVVTAVEPGDGDAVVGAGRVQAWVVGPGLGTDAAAERVVEAVLGSAEPVVVDADGLTVLSRRPDLVRDRTAPTLLTPHAGEFARFGAPAGGDRIAATRRLAADLGATVLLKGTRTVVADPDGLAFVNPTGTPELATAGSGDVLSGACGALLAGGLPALEAAAVAAFLHGLAARAADAPVIATDLLDSWTAAVRAVVSGD